MKKQNNSKDDVLLEVKNLSVDFFVKQAGYMGFGKKISLRAVDNISFKIRAGETLGIVGESGCGKSTLARAIIRMLEASEGEVIFQNQNLLTLTPKSMKAKRRYIQIIFQDPLASLNPRMTIAQIVAEPLRVHFPQISKARRYEKVKNILSKVGINSNLVNRYPHEFSGGQCQRIGIARALISEPKLIICDEPVSALDVSIQAQIVNLLMKLQKDMNLSLIFIAHDLSIVRHISHRIMVMYMGQAVEIAESKKLIEQAKHPYTHALIDAVPSLIPGKSFQVGKKIRDGELPSLFSPPKACVFTSRCAYVKSRCHIDRPFLLSDKNIKEDSYHQNADNYHQVACHYPLLRPSLLKT